MRRTPALGSSWLALVFALAADALGPPEAGTQGGTPENAHSTPYRLSPSQARHRKIRAIPGGCSMADGHHDTLPPPVPTLRTAAAHVAYLEQEHSAGKLP